MLGCKRIKKVSGTRVEKCSSVFWGAIMLSVCICGMFAAAPINHLFAAQSVKSSVEETASFEDNEADFEETASFEDESAGENEIHRKGGVTASVHETAISDVPSVTGAVLHVGHYKAASHFPKRQGRTLEKKPYYWLLQLSLIIALAMLLASFKLTKRKRIGRFSFRFKTHSVLLIAAFLAVSGVTAHSITYSSVKDVVTSSLGKGKKIFQKKIPMTSAAKLVLKQSAGWSPKKSAYKAYYVKDANGKPERFAFILQDKLKICGGLHKYCVIIDNRGSVVNVQILELTCDRSYCINKRSFLSQFKTFNVSNHQTKGNSYDAISGATLSTDLTRDVVNRALALFKVLSGK